MRILCLCHSWFPDRIGGLERVARDAARALAARGNAVSAYVTVQSRRETAVEDGVHTHRVIRRFPVVPQTYSDYLGFRRLCQRLQARDYDVILAQHPVPAAAAIHSGLALPIVYVFHSSPVLEAVQRREHGVSVIESARSLCVEPGLRRFEASAAAGADRILLFSHFNRQILLKDHRDAMSRTRLVKTGVETEHLTSSPARNDARAHVQVTDDTTVLFTARRLVARTGVDLLIDAFAQVASERSDLQLVIAGDGENRSVLEGQASAAGLGDRVRFLGRISDELLGVWYSAADAFVMPTLAYEGFGLATVEALSMGLPVACTPAGATPEIISQIAPQWIAGSVSAAALAASIRRSLDARSPNQSERCRQLARSYSWEDVAAVWEQELASTIESHHARG